MGLQPVNLGSQTATSAADGATIERRIRINQPDEGSARCKGSRAYGPRKDFSQCIQNTKYFQRPAGQLDYVDEQAKRVVVRRKNGEEINLPYAELILALLPVPNLTRISGMMAHASPIDSVGDALHIRKGVIDRIEEAEIAEVAAERDRLLTFAIVGSGRRACATAVELCQMLRTAEASYPVLREHGWKVYRGQQDIIY